MNNTKQLTIIYAALAMSLTLMTGCDAVNIPELRPGTSTASEVRARMGLPTAEHHNEDGSVTYEYNRQPAGVECFMITIGQDQIVQSIEQVLNEANLARVKPGMSRQEVRRLLCKAASVSRYENSQEEVWDWRIKGSMPTEETHFHVHFDPASGKVKSTSRRVEPKA